MTVDTFRVQAGFVPACTADPDLFYSDDPEDADYAKSVCRRCPLRLNCLEGAMDRREAYGIFGGKDPAERGALTKKRNQHGPRSINADERRARVADLCDRMAPAKVAEILAVPVKTVYRDRASVGIARPYRSHAEVAGDVAGMYRGGASVPQIAARMYVSERTVNRWLRKLRTKAAA
jgi:WhiB family transcriptional regulator, redox-sensing transcriptional regulator